MVVCFLDPTDYYLFLNAWSTILWHFWIFSYLSY